MTIKHILISFISCLFFGSIIAQDSTSKVFEAFPLSEISEAMDESKRELRPIEDLLKSDNDLNTISEDFRNLLEESATLREDTSRLNMKVMSLAAIKDLSTEWKRYSNKIKSLEDQLLNLNMKLDEYKTILDELKIRWLLTKEFGESRESAEVILERIKGNIQVIEDLEVQRKNKQERSFVLLDSLTEEHLFVSSIVDQIGATEKELRANIFTVDSPKFFEMVKDSTDTLSVGQAFNLTWRKTNQNNVNFFKENRQRVWTHLVLFIVFFVMFFFFRKSQSLIQIENSKAYELFNHFVSSPFLSALIFGLFISYWLYPNRPPVLSEEILMLLIFPVSYLLIGLNKSIFRIAIIAVTVLYFLNEVLYFMSAEVFLQREILMLETVLGLVFSIYLLLPGSGFTSLKANNNWAIVKLFPIIPLLFIWSIYLNVEGNMQLSKLITSSIIKASAVGVALYAVVLFIEGMLEYLIASRASEVLRSLKEKSKQIRYWGGLIARGFAIYMWVTAVTRQLRLENEFNDWWDGLMAIGWDFGEVSLSIGLLVDFILIIIIFAVVANILRYLLEVEILPRFNMKKGVPMAIGVVTRYFVLVLGFFMAIAAAGINLDKLGFIAGALGVGIGFGLQNVVNNFVSGLILVFERPIRIDDVITAGEVEGVVKEVGIRSSTIKTWDGAEVMVPNADLVSFKVTNWTLSDTKRRREYMLKVESGSDPNEVIKVVKEIMDKNEDVLDEPNSLVLFLGQTTYSLDFRILYWISARLLVADSELILEIHNQLKKAGIKLAIPKQRMIYEGDSPVKKAPIAKKAPATKRTTPVKKPAQPAKDK